jgi:hypothetical protein
MSVGRSFALLRTGLRARMGVWLYRRLFRLLSAVVPQVDELDAMLQMLDGEEDARFL